MNRTQKKCLIGSAGFHLLLLLVLFIGPAFLSEDKKDLVQPITMIDPKLIDHVKLTFEATQTGGQPTPPPAPAPAPAARQPPQAEPPAPEPPKKTAETTPEPVKVHKEAIEPAPKKEEKLKPESMEVSETPKRPKIEVNKSLVKRNNEDAGKARAKAQAEATARAQAAAQKRAEAFNRAAGNIEQGLSTSTEVNIPGPGAGTFVNYGDALAQYYYRAWILPTEAADENASVKVKVIVARDGTITLARVTHPSGNVLVDRSVEETLRRVKNFRPFPEGATDPERTFLFDFQPKFRKLIG